jgi:very-short-patch-repair endonuclease
MKPADRRLVATATGQLGAFDRSQAHAAGLSDRQLRSRVQSGALQRAGTSTYRLPGLDPSNEALLRQLVMDVGGVVWVSGPTAAALYQLDDFVLKPPFHVTIERGRDVQRVGHRIHTTKVMPPGDQTERFGFLTTSPARTVIDMARDQPVARLETAVESGMRDRWFSEALLRRRIVELQAPGRFGVEKLTTVLDERNRKLGAHSWLEAEFLRLVERAGLQRPECQQVLTRARDRVVRVDFRFPRTNLVVEVLGYRFHRSKVDMQRDAERLNALVLDGFRALQFTYEDVVSSPDQVAHTLARLTVSAHTT